MTQYKVRNSKNDDGTYTLSYGKGSKKLTATMAKTQSNMWDIISGGGAVNVDGHKTMKECKAAWGAWAEDAYGNESESKAESDTSPDQQSPKSPATPGPPSFKRPAKPKPTGKNKEPLGFEHNADPFDPRFKNEDKELTPLGVLIEIAAWCERHADAIKAVEKKTYPQAAFTNLIEQAKYTLRRECPDIFNGDDDEQEEKQPAAPAASTTRVGPPPPPTFSKPAAPALTREGLEAATRNYNSAGATLERIDEDDIPF